MNTGNRGFIQSRGGGWTSTLEEACYGSTPNYLGRTPGLPNYGIGFRTVITYRMPAR